GPAVRDTPAALLRAAAPGQRAPITLTEPGVELAIVVPTFEERDNIAPLIARLTAALAGIAWEVVFVDDDSSDGTADLVRAGARASCNASDGVASRVRVSRASCRAQHPMSP